MFIKYKPYLGVFLVVTALSYAAESAAKITKAAHIFHPTTNCELIRDIQAANAAGGGPNIIDLAGNVFELTTDCATEAATCSLLAAACYANKATPAHGLTGLPEINASMLIVNGRIVRSNSQATPAFRLLTVLSPAVLSLFKVTLENGLSDNGGAAYVSNGSMLNMQSSKFAFNRAVDSGGAIFVDGGGILEVQTSVISHNKSNAANNLHPKAGGGGIYIALLGKLGSLDNSTISNNATPGLGGGINNQGSATNIFNSTFSYNKTCTPTPGSGEGGGGCNPSGAGGGIYNDITATFLEITQCTFWANRSYLGGAIYNEEATPVSPVPPPTNGVYLNNNTIANNFSERFGGGIYNIGIINQFVSNLVAANTDFDANKAPDIFNAPGAFIFKPALGSPVQGKIVEGFNLVGDCGTTGQCGLINDVNFDIIGGSVNASPPANIDPRLHDLRKNGGPTETVALLPDSPALNNGYNNLKLEFDQRRDPFYRVVGQCDIGSYEFQYD